MRVPPRGPGEAGRLCRKTRRGQEALPEGRIRLGVPPSWPGGFRRPSRRTEIGRDKRGQESPQEGQKDWEALPDGWAGVGRPFRRAGRSQEGQERLGGYLGVPGGVRRDRRGHEGS